MFFARRCRIALCVGRSSVRRFGNELSESHQSNFGTLYVVAMPIGNVHDVSFRAAQLLAQVPVVAAEIVHVAEAWLRFAGEAAGKPSVSPRIVSYHAHNELERVPELLHELRSGQDVALVCRSGTPSLRDPGQQLVQRAHMEGIRVSALPGPSSLTAALSVSGLPGDRLFLEGYLATLRPIRLQRLYNLRNSDLWQEAGGATLAFFCDGVSLGDILADLDSVFGSEARACVAKELSTPREWIRTAPLLVIRDLWNNLTQDDRRGSLVVLIEASRDSVSSAISPRVHNEGQPQASIFESADEQSLQQVVQVLLEGGVPVNKAAVTVARLTGVPLPTANLAVRSCVASSNAADVQVGVDGSPPTAQKTLYLMSLGPEVSEEQLMEVLAEAGAASKDLKLTRDRRGQLCAFVRFASPALAAAARMNINLASIDMGAPRPVLAGWARREKWVG